MTESKLEISLPGEWLVKKLLGPTADDVGADFAKLYKAGRNKILNAAHRKVENIDDGAKSNLRVTRDVFWNGSFSDSDICAEYYSGALASSRSKDGKDDSAIFYLNRIQSLSSSQLHLHYIIYNCLNKLLTAKDQEVNVGDNNELSGVNLYLSTVEVMQALGIPLDRDLVALFKSGLIEQYRMNQHDFDEEKKLPYTMTVPTTLGIQLYAISHNKLAAYRAFSREDFGDFSEIKSVQHFYLDLNELIAAAS